MSSSLLKKSLKLFEEETKSEKSIKKKIKSSQSVTTQKQATLKDKKVKSALDEFVKKHPKEDKTTENLAFIQKISLKNTVSQDTANKIFSYQLKKQHKIVDDQPKKENQKSIFTEADFQKFEAEYFVKA